MPRIRDLFISQDFGPQIPAQIQTLVTMFPKPRVANYDKIQFLKSDEVISFDSFGTMKILEVRRYWKLKSD